MYARIAAFVTLLLIATSFAQQPPAPAAPPAPPAGGMPPMPIAENPPFTIGQPVVRTYPEQRYFYMTEEATQKTMPQVMALLVPQLMEAAKEAQLGIPGPVLIVINSMPMDADTPFEVEAGLIVPADVKPVGGADVRPLEPGKFLTLVYTGRMDAMVKGYEALMGSLFASGRQMNGNLRQMVLYVEDDKPESSNNIMLLMVGLQ